ncbi:TrbG/VirB9 family P-type conjugative transfer protein (plasmid) [Hydrogenophaga sp. BPS33]|nr:TrbG/VirB9 family P-type conjugative transfer protein [Hydrogenophaga sp. BPS33]
MLNARGLSAALAVAALLLAHQPATAELIATPLRGDTRLVEFQFDADNTFLVLAKPRAVTHLQFAPDEVIMSVAAGDTSNWEITPTKNRKNLFLKPRYEDLETSLTVLTDKRPYQFVLKSTGDGRKWYQRVSWVYAKEVLLEMDPSEVAGAAEDEAERPTRLKEGQVPVPSSAPGAARSVEGKPRSEQGDAGALGINPSSMRFNYRIEGDAPFRPDMVFDDGKFTYFRMPANLQEQPALFAVIEGNEYSLVNYTVNGDYIVAQRLLETAVLKLGKPEVRVHRVIKRNWLGQVVQD